MRWFFCNFVLSLYKGAPKVHEQLNGINDLMHISSAF